MTIDFVRLIFIWLLPLTASNAVTSGQNHSFTNVMTGEVGNTFTHNQLTTQEASSLNPLSEVSGHNIRQHIIVDGNPTKEKTTKPSTKPSLQTTQTKTSKTFLPNIQTVATPNPISSQINSSTGIKSMTEVQFKVTTSATTVVTSQGSNPTTTTKVPPVLSSSTQSQDTRTTSTSQLTSDKITHPSTHPTQSTNLIDTITTSTKPVENKSTSTSPVTGGDATQSTGLCKTSMATTKTPFTITTKAKKRQDPPEKNAKSKKETNHSKAVAGLIGGALVLMMVGFLVIYMKKRKLQRQQITTRDWAGPSPFLEGGADNGQVTLRSSNQISLTSFLPQRLSKRLSLLPETDEELEDMTPGTTFGDKHQGSTFGREVDANDIQESNGTAVVVPEMKSTGDAPETV
ncbi:mucin-5AC-like [Siniperca chuatsi]|uniref:mucin-5AC-like n=1 Tax=Siniperca chuatsi TaxID=119488 RepID=UPI001CE0FB8C|nr:mucin-5AC-like [Siniperca chuatsi]